MSETPRQIIHGLKPLNYMSPGVRSPKKSASLLGIVSLVGLMCGVIAEVRWRVPFENGSYFQTCYARNTWILFSHLAGFCITVILATIASLGIAQGRKSRFIPVVALIATVVTAVMEYQSLQNAPTWVPFVHEI